MLFVIPGIGHGDNDRNGISSYGLAAIWRDVSAEITQWAVRIFGQAGQGYQWTSATGRCPGEHITYLPEPPASVEAGPDVRVAIAR